MRRERDFSAIFDRLWFVKTSRIIMVLGTLIGLPVAGYAMKRMVDQSDKVIDLVLKSDKRLDLLEQFVRFTSKDNKEFIKDHETRLRLLERAAPIIPYP